MKKDKDGKDTNEPRTVTDEKLSGICQNMEKPISFSRGQFRFVYSSAFLSSSLDRLVQNTPKENLWITSEVYFCFGSGTLRQLMDKKFDLVTRRGGFPYDYMDSFDRFQETQLPPKENFYSSLTDESISSSDPEYQHAQEVWATFDCQTIGDYHDLYLRTDVLLLADVFENFRRTAMATYGLDPDHYLTLPGYSWDALLESTKVSLELITNPDMYLFIEKGLRGASPWFLIGTPSPTIRR